MCWRLCSALKTILSNKRVIVSRRIKEIFIVIEPVALADFFLSFFSGAMIVLLAALYAGLFAWAQITAKAAPHYAALLVYGLLLVCVAIFAKVYHLNGYWQILTVTMVAGYWWMPRLIWRLCVQTHAD